ncbi:MAG: helix-turn-helix transcriptional regulator [Kofleriaceae bacterium]
MSSTTRLLVLGIVRMFQPVHGYDVRRELMSWHVDEWASVAPGSIYNALKTLTRERMLEIVDTAQVAGRPERTTYRLTARGEQEFNELLRDTWWTVRMPFDPLAAAIALIGFTPREEAIAALEARIAQVQGQIAHREYAISAIDDREIPAHVRELMRLLNARISAEIAWAQALIPRLRSGEYRMAEDPPWVPWFARAGEPGNPGKAPSREAQSRRPPLASGSRRTPGSAPKPKSPRRAPRSSPAGARSKRGTRSKP